MELNSIMFQINGAADSNNASFFHSAVETLNSQGLVSQNSGVNCGYSVVVNTINASPLSCQGVCDDAVSLEVIPTLFSSPLTPFASLYLASSITGPVANLASPRPLQIALSELATGNVGSYPSLSTISGIQILPSVQSAQHPSLPNLVPDTPLPDQMSQMDKRTSRSKPKALRRLLPKATTESVNPSVSAESMCSHKGLESSVAFCKSDSSDMCKNLFFKHPGGPATYCQAAQSCAATRASVKVSASVNTGTVTDTEVKSNLILPTKAKKTPAPAVGKLDKATVRNGENDALHVQPSALQTKVSEQSTKYQFPDSYSAPKQNESLVPCAVNDSRHRFHVTEPCTSTSTQCTTGDFINGENESLGNNSLSRKERLSLSIIDSGVLELDFSKKQACLSPTSYNPTGISTEEGYESLFADSATENSEHQFVKAVPDVHEGFPSYDSYKPTGNFQNFGTYSPLEVNKTHHFNGAFNYTKRCFTETVLDARITAQVSAQTAVGSESSQSHGSCSALETNSWSQITDSTVASSNNQSHGRRPSIHNSHDPAGILVDRKDRNTSVQEKEVGHLVWQENDSDSEETVSFNSIHCEQEKAEVQDKVNSCSDDLKPVDSKRRHRSTGAKSSIDRKQPIRACKYQHLSGSSKTALLTQKPQRPKKPESSHLIITVPNCIGRPCVVVMGRLNDKIVKAGHVNLAAVKEEDLLIESKSLEVKVFPGKVILAARRATLQDACNQPSKEVPAEQTQGDYLSLLLEERRAYMSQLHSVFNTTDYSSI